MIVGRFFFVLFIWSLLMGCSSKPNIESEIIQAIERSGIRNKVESKKMIVTLPQSGCISCIKMADNLLVEHNVYDHSKMFFVFTRLLSLKELRFKYGSYIQLNNTMIDRNGLFVDGELNVKYPIAIFMNGSKVDRISFITPDNERILFDIQKYIDE